MATMYKTYPIDPPQNVPPGWYRPVIDQEAGIARLEPCTSPFDTPYRAPAGEVYLSKAITITGLGSLVQDGKAVGPPLWQAPSAANGWGANYLGPNLSTGHWNHGWGTFPTAPAWNEWARPRPATSSATPSYTPHHCVR